jgi:hypothetical protein
VSWDAARAAAFYDEYGEREWTHFEDGRTSRSRGTLGKGTEPTDAAVRDLLTRLELDLAAEPGALDCAPHVLAVLRKDQ